MFLQGSREQRNLKANHRAVSIVRRTMTPVTLSDGLHVPVGNWFGIPQHSILSDEAFYPNADCFQADRFVTSKDTRSNYNGVRRFTFPDLSFPFWGSTKQSWLVLVIHKHSRLNLSANNPRHSPGRFYVSMVVKMVLMTILSEYEIESVDESVKSTWTFGPHMLPSSSLRIRMRALG